MRFEADAEGANDLVEWLDSRPDALDQDLFKVLDNQGYELQRAWSLRAKETAGRHGKHYPKSITSGPTVQQEGSIYIDVGPDNAKLQGRMGPGFEYGSVNQPPHHDGALAFADREPKVVSAVDEAVGKVVE